MGQDKRPERKVSKTKELLLCITSEFFLNDITGHKSLSCHTL